MARSLLLPAITLTAAAVVAACGSAGSAQYDSTPTVVVAMPHEGPSATIGRDTERAARMQFESERGRRGLPADLKLRFVDETLPGADAADPAHVANITEVELASRSVVGWIGGIDSDALAVELPRLNESGVPTVSPAATATPFLQPDPAFPGAPAKYYPALEKYGRTFARTAPPDVKIAPACLQQMRRFDRVRRVFTVDAGDTDGDSFSSAVTQAAPVAGIAVAGHESTPAVEADWAGIAEQLVATRADALIWGSAAGNGEDRLARSLRAAGWSGKVVAGPGFAISRLGTISGVGGPAYSCSAATVGEGATGSDDDPFASQFSKRWGHLPAPGAVRGANAMAVLLDSLAGTGLPGPAGSRLERYRAAAGARLRRLSRVGSMNGPITLSHGGQWDSAPLAVWVSDGRGGAKAWPLPS